MSEAHKIAHIHNLQSKTHQGEKLIEALNIALDKHAICWERPYDNIDVDWLFQHIDLASKTHEVLTLPQFFAIIAEERKNL